MYSRIQKAIEDFDLREYVEEVFEDVIPANNNEELRINCFAPNGCAKGDNKHKLYVNPGKKCWICFKCNYGTNQQPGTNSLVRFIADAEGISPIMVRHRLARAVHPSPPEELADLLQNLFEPTPDLPRPEQQVITLPHTFYPLTEAVGASGKAALTYAKSRGLTSGELIWYNTRYRPITSSCGEKQWDGRIIFPIYDLGGRLRSASGRLFTTNHASKPRWWHWPNSDLDQLLWPLRTGYPHRNFGSHIVLTEGIFDALAVNQLSDQQALCTFGHKLSQGQIEILQEIGTRSVTLAWDRDSKQAMINAATNLEMHGITTKLIPFIHDSFWTTCDLGTTITKCMSWSQDEMQTILLDELANPLSCHSPEFMRWVIQ